MQFCFQVLIENTVLPHTRLALDRLGIYFHVWFKVQKTPYFLSQRFT